MIMTEDSLHGTAPALWMRMVLCAWWFQFTKCTKFIKLKCTKCKCTTCIKFTKSKFTKVRQ